MTTVMDGNQRVPLSSLKRYLTVSGWRRRTLPSGLELFEKGPAGDSVEIVLPATSNVRDLSERLDGAVAVLSALERRPSEKVIAAIRSISYDLVRSRLPDSAIRRDTIKLKTAEDFIRRMTKILAASAQGELQVSPYFPRIDANAQRYADECRFGHTFRGSFGFVVESRVGPNTHPPLVSDEVIALPLERRAIERLARGLRIIETAIAQEDPSEIVKGYERGLNANACEDLAALIETPGVEQVNFEIVFSPEWGVPRDLGPAPATEIRRLGGGLEVIEEAVKALRYVHYEKVRTVVGMVRTLHSMENPSDLISISGNQDIVVEWDSEEFGRKKVWISLGPQEYLQAVEAHKAGRMISTTGELEQTARRWRLENPRDFSVL